MTLLEQNEDQESNELEKWTAFFNGWEAANVYNQMTEPKINFLFLFFITMEVKRC